MLKVMKYDWKNGWNNIRITLLLAVIVSVVSGILLRVFDKAAANLSLIWFAVMLAMFILTVSLLFRNMVNGMFGPQGYLTHTLPVDTWELLLGKAAGTWIFGVFMATSAVACWMLLLLTAGTDAKELESAIATVFFVLPKLGAYFFRFDSVGTLYAILGIPAFLAVSFLLMIQFQFACILSKEFGRFQIAGGLIVFLVMGTIEGVWNHSEPIGILIVLVCSAISFAGSHWLLKHRLSV